MQLVGDLCSRTSPVVCCFKIQKLKKQQFGDRLHVYPEVRRVEGSTFTAEPGGKAVLYLWLIMYSPDPFLSECRNTARHVLNFCIRKNWTVEKVQQLGGANCNIMWSEL
jgi:hypothetical protein